MVDDHRKIDSKREIMRLWMTRLCKRGILAQVSVLWVYKIAAINHACKDIIKTCLPPVLSNSIFVAENNSPTQALGWERDPHQSGWERRAVTRGYRRVSTLLRLWCVRKILAVVIFGKHCGDYELLRIFQVLIRNDELAIRLKRIMSVIIIILIITELPLIIGL